MRTLSQKLIESGQITFSRPGFDEVEGGPVQANDDYFRWLDHKGFPLLLLGFGEERPFFALFHIGASAIPGWPCSEPDLVYDWLAWTRQHSGVGELIRPKEILKPEKVWVDRKPQMRATKRPVNFPIEKAAKW
jgi:hypothetical protein